MAHCINKYYILLGIYIQPYNISVSKTEHNLHASLKVIFEDKIALSIISIVLVLVFVFIFEKPGGILWQTATGSGSK